MLWMNGGDWRPVLELIMMCLRSIPYMLNKSKFDQNGTHKYTHVFYHCMLSVCH